MANYSKRDQRRDDGLAMAASMPERVREERAQRATFTPATLRSEMEVAPRWTWFICPRCGRRSPLALAQFAIRWGMNVAMVDVARFLVICGNCGSKNALMQRPGIGGTGGELEHEPFPADQVSRGLEKWLARRIRTRCPAPLRMAAMQ